MTESSIAVGDRVLFTNPVTGQQLVGTVIAHHPDHPNDRAWLVDFDSWMFKDIDTTKAHVDRNDLMKIDWTA